MNNLNDIRKQCDILYMLSLTPPHTLSVDLPERVLYLLGGKCIILCMLFQLIHSVLPIIHANEVGKMNE
jgi:hypothetical protein